MNTFAKVDKETFLKFAADHQGQWFEFVRGRIVQQMPGGTRRHGRVGDRFYSLIDRQLDPAKWTVLRERGVETPDTIRYGDVVVEPATEPDSSLTTTRAALVIEVLSPSSIADDLEHKPHEYFAVKTLLAYVVASQSEPACRVWLREAGGAMPAEPVAVEGIDATIEVPALGLSIPLAEVYRGILDQSAAPTI